MCCVEQQHLSDKNRLILRKIEAFYRHFKAFFAIFALKRKSAFPFKKCVRIKPSILDNLNAGILFPKNDRSQPKSTF